jgi:flagellar assembly factor FliW
MESVTFQTERFGPVQVQPERLLEFVSPILGFEHAVRYAVLDHGQDDSPFRWLQATEDPKLAFVITSPHLFGLEFEFVLPEEAVEMLGIESIEDVVVFTIVTIPDDNPSKMTANLLGPIIINQTKRLAMQLVLADDAPYSAQTRLIPDAMLKLASLSAPAEREG